MAKVNGKEYSWVDCEITVEGKSEPLTGVTGIAYDTKRDHENVMGKGKTPVAQWSGGEKPDGCFLILLQSEFEAWQKSLPRGRKLTSLAPFNITISYAPEDGPRTTDRLVDCLIAGQPKETGVDKKHMEIKMDLVVRDIEYNID